jgi:hypothetical protein
MSQTIWTRCGGLSNVRALFTPAWRVVEDQFQNSTLKLVETVQEQAILEHIIDESAKPAAPKDPEFQGLHFLLSTPFRYLPFPSGSRFATARERNLWYGAQQIGTALAEKAYYRFVFLLGTTADLGSVEQAWSAFSVSIATGHGVDLTAAPFVSFASRISSPISYAEAQVLGREMRSAGVLVVMFTSARDKEKGTNIGLFRPAFTSPFVPESAHVGWMSRSNRDTVQVFRKNHARPADTVRQYARQSFEIDGTFPIPGFGV